MVSMSVVWFVVGLFTGELATVAILGLCTLAGKNRDESGVYNDDSN